MGAENQAPGILILTGKTATGKTDLALALSARAPVDLISVDSALVYQGLNIGTDKPDAATLLKHPHALVDVRKPTESYSAAQFLKDVRPAIQDALKRGRIPLLVGGSMLYFKVLRFGITDFPPVPPAIREQILAEAKVKGWPAMHQCLALVDPQAARRLAPHDSQRIGRALEIFRSQGKPLTELWEKLPKHPGISHPIRAFALRELSRESLRERIGQRFRAMLALGLVEELQMLRQQYDLHPGMPAMRIVGYRQTWEYLEARLTWDELVSTCIHASRQIAKRQGTWLSSWAGLEWLPANKDDSLTRMLHVIDTDRSIRA